MVLALVVGEIVLLLLASVGVIWAWGVFLDNYEHDPARVRAVMFLGVAAATMFESWLQSHGLVQRWVLWASLVANIWGAIDAVLRFPAAHSLESFFSAKQFGLLAMKTLAYTAGMVDFRRYVWLFLIILVTNIWSWPVLYTMSLPMDPAEQVVKDDAYDVDLVLRVWRLVGSAPERRACLSSCRSWWYRRLFVASEGSTIARLAICATSAEHRRIFKKIGRTV
mmetsp:Transcript_109624/g.316986  ORF Transcript_109624/g.316986 Transcript_109624/m.316986 type:complete len:223 (+) Transcript_109624:96-764(+)